MKNNIEGIMFMFSFKNKWKSSLYLIEHHSMQAYIDVEV